MIRVAIASHHAAFRRRLDSLLSDYVRVATHGDAPFHLQLAGEDLDVVIWDGVAGAEAPETIVAQLSRLTGQPDVISVQHERDPSVDAHLVTSGCSSVLFAGLTDEALGAALRALIERRRREGIRLVRARHNLGQSRLSDFVSRSTVMQQFMGVVERLTDSESSLLITGETGVGKERLARAIHAEGARSRAPFIAVNCGALPEGLLGSELFGHERGAFTDASRTHRGCFELADGGTIFLDEVGEMPPHLQVALLRVLETRQVQRLGSEQSFHVDVRIVAATNVELESEVLSRRFRKDLYYRLAVVTLTVPPLRERREDIPDLFTSYVDHFRTTLGRSVTDVAPEALAALADYAWPGNVRELINVAERAVLLANGSTLGLADLPRAIALPHVGTAGTPTVAAQTADDNGTLPFRSARAATVERFERDYIERLLIDSRGSLRQAARAARMNERTLYNLMRRHGLAKEDFKPRPLS